MKRPQEVDVEFQDTANQIPFPDSKRAKKMFQTRCNPKLNYMLLQKHKDKADFRRILKELRLDGLLELRVTRLHRELCAALASKVDVSRSCLNVHGKEIPMTYASVTKVLGLPSSGNNTVRNDISLPTVHSKIAAQFNLSSSGKVSIYTLQSYLQSATHFGSEFKAKFVLLIIATLIKPTTNVNLHFREFIPLLSRLDILNDFNWGKFLLDGLLEAVRVYQLKNAKSVGGCLLYLQLLYVHCISPVTWSSADTIFVATPCLASCTDERVSQVLKQIRAQGGLESPEVHVRTTGIPSHNMHENPLLPQLLMHHFCIERIKRDIDGQGNEISMLKEQLQYLMQHINSGFISIQSSGQLND